MSDSNLATNVLEALWFGDDDPERSRREASEGLSAQVARIKGVKPFPAIAQRILQLVEDPEVRVEQVTGLIESDPAIAARTMQLANSALFRVGQPVDTLEQALVRVGMHTIYQMVIAFAVLGSFEDTGSQGRSIRDHSVGVAAIGRTLARRRSWPGYGQVFLCGLLHDLGKLLLLQGREFTYNDLPSEHQGPDRVHLYERSRLGYDHAVLGGHVLNCWELPMLASRVVAWHHQPARAYAEGGDEALLVAFLRVADRIEYSLRNNVEINRAFFEELARDASAAYVDLGAQDLEQDWETLVLSRREALSSFS